MYSLILTVLGGDGETFSGRIIHLHKLKVFTSFSEIKSIFNLDANTLEVLNGRFQNEFSDQTLAFICLTRLFRVARGT